MNINHLNVDKTDRYKFMAQAATDLGNKYEAEAKIAANIKEQRKLEKKKKKIKERLAMIDNPRSIEAIVAEIISNDKLSVVPEIVELRAAVMSEESLERSELDDILASAGYPVDPVPVMVGDVVIPITKIPESVEVDVDVETELTLTTVTTTTPAPVTVMEEKFRQAHQHNSKKKRK